VVVEETDREPPVAAVEALFPYVNSGGSSRGGNFEGLEGLAVDEERHADRLGPGLVAVGPGAEDVSAVAWGGMPVHFGAPADVLRSARAASPSCLGHRSRGRRQSKRHVRRSRMARLALAVSWSLLVIGPLASTSAFGQASGDIRELKLREWEPRSMLVTKTT